MSPDRTRVAVPDDCNFGTEDEPVYAVNIPGVISFEVPGDEGQAPFAATTRLLNAAEVAWGMQHSGKGIFNSAYESQICVTYPISFGRDVREPAQEVAA